jgi:hypothetical protein
MSYNISGRILKDLQNFTAPILTIIFQKSPQTGCIPTDWKHANVAPAYKKGEKYNATNYRPISLTCISCKIMEHVITKHILNHLESNSLLYDLQHGFRHSRSCEAQLLSFVQELAANSDKNIQTDLIIMDFAKAFDSHQPVTFPSCGSIKVFLETITIFLGFDSFVDDAVVGEQSELAGFHIF